ncbi:hypothetical protein BGZ74_006822 [Mortierella antarctica]|nr:hypothetical protein BGZ74_006822 [Mortierella antarctica]
MANDQITNYVCFQLVSLEVAILRLKARWVLMDEPAMPRCFLVGFRVHGTAGSLILPDQTVMTVGIALVLIQSIV